MDKQFDSKFQTAIDTDNVEALNGLLEKHPGAVYNRNSRDSTPLHRAAKKGSEESASTLISKDAFIDALDNYNRTPLHEAALMGDVEIVKIFIKSGASLEVRDMWGKTPLHDAAMSGSMETVRCLLQEGAKVNIRDWSGQTPLHIAAEDCKADIAKLLIEMGADPDVKNNIGETPLHKAADVDLVEGREEVKTLRLLLKRSDQLNIRSVYKQTPFFLALSKGQKRKTEIIEEFMEKERPEKAMASEEKPSPECDPIKTGLEMIKTVMNIEKEASLLLNGEHKVVICSEKMAEMLGGKNPEEFTGKALNSVLKCSRKDGEVEGIDTCFNCSLLRLYNECLREEKAVRECSVTDLSNYAADFQVMCNRFEFDGHKYILTTIKDISDEKRRRALERIFFHDILNTAGNLYTGIRMLDDATPSQATQIQDILMGASTSLIEEIRAQRELAAAENDELSVFKEEVNSLVLLKEIADQYRNNRKWKGRKVILAENSCDREMITDKTLLKRVLSNMMKNAMEATPPGGKITIGCDGLDDHVKFWVHNPAHIPEEVQSKIFKRSFSTKGKDRGLGTYSMRLLTHRYLQGEVDFSSAPKEGTTFYAVFPEKLK